jgi:hypothetical protein
MPCPLERHRAQRKRNLIQQKTLRKHENFPHQHRFLDDRVIVWHGLARAWTRSAGQHSRIAGNSRAVELQPSGRMGLSGGGGVKTNAPDGQPEFSGYFE